MSTYDEIVKQISELQKQAEEIKAREQTQVINEIRQKIVQHALTAEDLGFSGKPVHAKQTTRRKVPVRYRDTEGNTWTGRGKRPLWLNRALATGRLLDDFLVAPRSSAG
jgi:DNA-binding protein H-NS